MDQFYRDAVIALSASIITIVLAQVWERYKRLNIIRSKMLILTYGLTMNLALVQSCIEYKSMGRYFSMDAFEKTYIDICEAIDTDLIFLLSEIYEGLLRDLNEQFRAFGYKAQTTEARFMQLMEGQLTGFPDLHNKISLAISALIYDSKKRRLYFPRLFPPMQLPERYSIFKKSL
ncbi:MAG: hypothetical protein WAX04_12970 [Oscillospiraceae bacterium]